MLKVNSLLSWRLVCAYTTCASRLRPISLRLSLSLSWKGMPALFYTPLAATSCHSALGMGNQFVIIILDNIGAIKYVNQSYRANRPRGKVSVKFL